MTRRRYTLIYHTYIGYGGYNIDFRKVFTTNAELEKIKQQESDLHFIVQGWPAITYPDQTTIAYRKSKNQVRRERVVFGD